MYSYTECFITVTTPHVVDPKNPGAVDEIVHLGDHWNEEGLRAHKKEILALNQEIGRLFKRACFVVQKGDEDTGIKHIIIAHFSRSFSNCLDCRYFSTLKPFPFKIPRASRIGTSTGFQDIEARRQKVLARILELAQEVNGKQGS
ncbi:hypothetical protein [Desulfofundulus australicus]|uniref:hypothetical protein n=1 Tax=Desulfofundulus australicus TaxID=1566 RepID=UPI000932DEA6